MLEAINMCQQIAGRELLWTYSEENRIGDHIWYISDNHKFISHYPNWQVRYDVPHILQETYEANRERWQAESGGPKTAVDDMKTRRLSV